MFLKRLQDPNHKIVCALLASMFFLCVFASNVLSMSSAKRTSYGVSTLTDFDDEVETNDIDVLPVPYEAPELKTSVVASVTSLIQNDVLTIRYIDLFQSDLPPPV